jgi:DNA-binding transcriptional MerR regulator
LYRKKDIGRFLRVKKLLHTEGFTIAGARKILSSGDKASVSQSSTNSAIEIDVDKLSEASDRLRRLRQSIAALRAECELDII